MIRLEGIRVTFARGTPLETPALRGVDLTIGPGEFVTVIGSNGAGKSTLLNAVSGEVRPECLHRRKLNFCFFCSFSDSLESHAIC